MAPESERAAMDFQPSKHAKSCPEFQQQANAENDGAVIDTAFPCNCEPTLTCSEVVERLEKCFTIAQPLDCFPYIVPDRKQAEAILHSWRERRVQELEEALRGMLRESVVLSKEYLETVSVGLRDSNTVQGWDIARWKQLIAAKESAEKVLANSEWREQIRKGAKHESGL